MEGKQLRLVFDENDDVIKLMKEEMRKHELESCMVIEGEGRIKQGTLEYFAQGKLKSKQLRNAKLLSAAGKFHKEGTEYLGALQVIVNEELGKQAQGKLTEARAGKHCTLTLKFYEF